jgi:hypothetical protein
VLTDERAVGKARRQSVPFGERQPPDQVRRLLDAHVHAFLYNYSCLLVNSLGC